MGGEQAASVLATVRRDGIEATQAAAGRTSEPGVHGGIRDQYERQGNPYYATARLWDDGVIDPLDTRRVLGLALSVAARARAGPEPYGVFRMCDGHASHTPMATPAASPR